MPWIFGGGLKTHQPTVEKKNHPTPEDIAKTAINLEQYINSKASIIGNETMILILTIIDNETTICHTQTMELPQATCYTLYSIIHEYIPNLIESYCKAYNGNTEQEKLLHTNLMQMLDSIKEIEKAVHEDNQKNLEIETRFLESKFERNSIEDSY